MTVGLPRGSWAPQGRNPELRSLTQAQHLLSGTEQAFHMYPLHEHCQEGEERKAG